VTAAANEATTTISEARRGRTIQDMFDPGTRFSLLCTAFPVVADGKQRGLGRFRSVHSGVLASGATSDSWRRPAWSNPPTAA